MKLIDKDALVAEIKKHQAIWDGMDDDYCKGQRLAYSDVISFLDTLEVREVREESVRKDLKYASEKYACRFSSSKYGHDKVKDAFIAGAKWQKEQMMKGLCYETKVYHDSDGTAEDGNYEEWWNLGQSEIIDIPVDELGLKDGDIVKVIIIKEEEE